jgi:hypothetical protein
MHVWFWIWLVVVLKIPIVTTGWLIWHVLQQTPDQEILGDGGGGVRFDPGPRKRGPHDGGHGRRKNGSRRRDAGHENTERAPSRSKRVAAAD